MTAFGSPSQPESDEAARLRAERTQSRVTQRTQAEQEELRRAQDVQAVRQTIALLSGPEMAGRAPGSPGLDRAAEAIEDLFLGLGLEPAFALAENNPDQRTYRQRFSIGSTVDSIASRTSFGLADGRVIAADNDLEVSIYSGRGAFAGPVSFVGYGIVAGPGTYLGFTGTESIEGHVVIMLSHEPMDDLGRSLWSDRGWSFAAPLYRKLSAVHRRGAKAVIVVDPPDHDPDANGSADPVGQVRTQVTPFEIPVVHISQTQADELLRGGAGRSLRELTRAANRAGIILPLQGITAAVQTNVEVVPLWSENVGAILAGRGNLDGEVVVITAHYEFRDPSQVFMATSDAEPNPAADDNASGVATMLLVAERLRDAYDALDFDTPARTILFLALSGGDKSHRGSNHYVEHPIIPITNHVIMLNIDAVGRYNDFPLQIGGVDSANELESIVHNTLLLQRIDAGPAEPETFADGDHQSFNDRNVPQLMFSTGISPEHGSIADTPDTIDADGIVTISTLVRTLALEFTTRPERPTFIQRGARPRDRQAEDPAHDRVRVGLIPAAGATGDGMLVARVSDDSTAARAGFRPGDRVLEWNGQAVQNAQHWASMIEQHRPGDAVSATIRRAGQTQTIEMILESAKEPRP